MDWNWGSNLDIRSVIFRRFDPIDQKFHGLIAKKIDFDQNT